jgi:predicted membrane protein
MENKDEQKADLTKKIDSEHKRGKIIGGLLVVSIGVLFLLKELGMEIPFWLFSWKMLLIVLGLFTVLKNRFKSAWGLTLMIIGGAFMVADFYPEVNITSLFFPVLIIIAGLFIIFKPRHKHHEHWNKWKEQHQFNIKRPYLIHGCYPETENNNDDFISASVYMGALKKSIVSKTFKGGKLKSYFSGVELNLSQADFEGQVILEIEQKFGGLELIVPANWEVKSELVAGFSSVEDNRRMQSAINGEAPKVLVLRGTNYFGGIEIKNY